MILVKTRLDKTQRGDLGLYAAEDIPKGTEVWKMDSFFDLTLESSFVESMTDEARKYVKKYSYLTPKGVWIMHVDDARFLNHSDDPNLVDYEQTTVALRDIQAGEELTCDYYSFDLHADKKLKNEF